MNSCQQLKVELVIGENTASVSVEDTFTVPDRKPCIEKIISIDHTVKVTHVEVIKDRVIIDGKLNLQVVYVADLPDQPVHHTHAQLDFSHVIEVPGADPGMKARVKVKVAGLSQQIDPERNDQYQVTALLTIMVKVTATEELNLMVAPVPGARTADLAVEVVVAEASEEAVASGKLTVPPQKPEIEKVLDIEAYPMIADKKIIDGGVKVEGAVQLHILYVARTGSQSVHHMHQMLHFTKVFRIPDALEGMHLLVEPQVTHVAWEIDDPCTLSVDVIMGLQITVTDPTEVSVVTDLPGQDAEKMLLRVECLVGEVQSQVVVKDTVDVPHHKPDAERVTSVTVDRVSIPEEDIVVIKDKVILSGTVEASVVYVSRDPDQSVHNMEATLKFRSMISVPGAKPDQQVKVSSMVVHATARPHDRGDQVNIEIVLLLTVLVVDPLQLEVVLCQAVSPLPSPPPCPSPAPPCPFPYVVQAGDTFWLLAMRYHVSVESIMAANPGVDPYNLMIGSVITIPCDP